ALRACLAAQGMQKAARARSRQPGMPPTVLRAGIHSGEVMVGVAGQSDWAHYRADGTTIHLASRLEKLAAPGTVVLSATAQRLVADQLDTRLLGVHTIRGLGGEMELHELLVDDERSAAAPLAQRPRWAPMVGRGELTQLLDGLVRDARGGTVRVVGLRGEAGIGKSRLLAEWCAGVAAAGAQVCTTHARGYASANAYGVIADLCRSLLGADHQPGTQDTGRSAGALRLLPVPPQYLPALNELLEVTAGNPDWLALSPTLRRRHTVDAAHWLVTQRLSHGPLVLVLEDIFLADRESQRVLEALVPRFEGVPLLICVSYRQDFAHRWSEAPWFVEHWIPPLREHDMRALGHAMLGRHASVLPVVEDSVERADGNPFFLEQLLITLIDEGALVGTPGAYRLARPQAEVRPPPSVAANICARVDRMPAAAKAALEAAAILGDPITPALIATMQGGTAAQAEELLRLCVASGLLIASSAPGGGSTEGQRSYPFRHALVQDVVGGTLTRPRRKALHQRAFAALRAHLREGDTESAPALTRHAFNGEEWEQAAIHAVKSMTRAVSRSANREALRLFELGVDASRRVADGDRGLSLELDLLLEASGALMALGQMDAIFANLERARGIATRLNNQRREASVLLQISVFLWMRGKYSQGLVCATEALEAGRLAQRRNLQMAAGQSRLMMLHALGRYREAAGEAAALRAEYRPELGAMRLMPGWATAPIVNLHSFHASSLWRLGDYAAAQDLLDQAYVLLSDFDHPYSRGLIDFVQGQVWVELGRFDDAQRLMRASVASCEVNDVPTMMAVCVSMLGSALARGGQPAEAVRLLDDVARHESHLARGGTYGETFVRMNLGVALRELGRFDEAVAQGRQALELALTGEQVGHAVEALYELGTTHARAGQPAQAGECLRRGLAQARVCEMPYFIERIGRQLRQDGLEALA
ncbi:MAG TPA: tetratricopeptide repeat protein, partial [Ramlibacter sp.]